MVLKSSYTDFLVRLAAYNYMQDVEEAEEAKRREAAEKATRKR